MIRAGLWLNLALIVGITLLSYTLLLWAFDITIGTLPAWAARG